MVSVRISAAWGEDTLVVHPHQILQRDEHAETADESCRVSLAGTTVSEQLQRSGSLCLTHCVWLTVSDSLCLAQCVLLSVSDSLCLAHCVLLSVSDSLGLAHWLTVCLAHCVRLTVSLALCL